jgi:hypothetical protein
MHIVNIIINYITRGLVVIAGIAFSVLGWTDIGAFPERDMLRVVGGAFLLFGIYRLVAYYFQMKRQLADEDE